MSDDQQMVTLPRADVLALAVEMAVSGVGLFRYKANQVLDGMGLPTVPMSASRERALEILKGVK